MEKEKFPLCVKASVIGPFDSSVMNQWMDGPMEGWTNRETDQRMDRASYRVACPQLIILGRRCRYFFFEIL